MLKLYYTPETCALASHNALEEAGARFQTARIDFGTNQQREPDYLAINPMGRVPALATRDGVLTEAPALLVYVAQINPAARLAPFDDSFDFARVQAFNSYLCSTVHVAHSHRMRGHRWADDAIAIKAMQRKVPQTVGECFDLIERSMFKGPWVMGETHSICDPYLSTLSPFLEGDGADASRFTQILEFGERMSERPAVKAALAEELR